VRPVSFALRASMLRSAPCVICDKAALVVRDIRFVFVTGYADHGLPAYRDRPTLRLKRTLQERLGTCQSLAPFRVWGPGSGAHRCHRVR